MGGYPTNNYISKYENDHWSKVGELKHQRKYHAAIAFNDEIFILGGRLEIQHNFTECATSVNKW